MSLARRTLLTSAAALGAAPILRARAQSRPLIKLGVLTDLSGTYRDNTGPTSVAAAQIAIDEMKPHLSFDVELTSADHQNKPDVSSSIARQWFDQGIDAAIDVPTSSVALAVAQVAKEKDKIMLNASATRRLFVSSKRARSSSITRTFFFAWAACFSSSTMRKSESVR